VVKEDVVFIKDGLVAQFDSVKEYLDAFRVHLENVRLKRLIRDEVNLNLDLEFLEAKLKFLIYMSEKKRKNSEIISFLSGFKKWISQKLSSIQIVKLSSDHIKETEDEIKRIKSEIRKTRTLIKKQESVVKKVTASLRKTKAASLLPKSNVRTPQEIDPEVEIFELTDEDEDI